ncbi:MAG: hypothetical protein AB7L92_02745 [Alphaproteobacteria bacterium]
MAKKRLSKKQCAGVIKDVLQAYGLWPDAGGNTSIQISEPNVPEDQATAIAGDFSKAGITPDMIRDYGFGAMRSSGVGGLLMANRIEEAISEPDRPADRGVARPSHGR